LKPLCVGQSPEAEPAAMRTPMIDDIRKLHINGDHGDPVLLLNNDQPICKIHSLQI
jgi:hypothetical protein